MTTDIETIKATVRSRLTTRLAPPANPIGAPFDHGDYIIEELAGDLIGFTRVNAFYDPSIGLPQDPSELDRYIATATANGWTKNNIYTYLDGTWHETNFEPGLTFAYVIAEDNYYGAYPAGWQELSIGGIDDYVTLTTDQNVTGKKTFSQKIGQGTTDPQSMIHINLPYEDWMGGIQISKGFADESDGVTINLAGADALYGVSYTGRHIFNIETRPGGWETGLVIEDTPVNGPVLSTPQIVVGEPIGSDMGIGSLNAEALYVNGEPVVTGTFDIDDYVTIATDQNITGQKSFTKKIGIGTTNPQRLLHLNTDDSSDIGIGIGRYNDIDNYLTIGLDGGNASYNIGYSGSHVFEVETAPGESEIGLWISGHFHSGPTVQAYQLVAGNPYGWGMGTGSINAEALYVEGEPVITGTFDIDDYVTLTTDQNISGQKNFTKQIGIGTTNPQRLLHINGSSSPGLQISNGFSDGDNGLSIKLESDAAVYSVDYNRVHRFRLETSPGVWGTGLTIEDTPSHGPICNMPMVNIGDPTGGSMGIGSINAESIYVNGEPVVTGTFDIDDYYTKTNLQTFGQSSVHAGNITNAPWLTSLPSHDHDTRYYTYTQLQTSGQSQVHANNITNAPWLTSLPSHNHDTRYYTKTQLQTSGQASVHWGNLTNKPSVFPPASHNHSASNITSGVLSNSRLSFNPDYFVQGETIRRSYNYGASNPLNNNNVSAFYTLSPDDPSNPPISAYGIHINSANANGYGLDIIGKGNQNKILWSGIDGGTRQPWREIWHEGNFDPSDYVTIATDQNITGQKTFDQAIGVGTTNPQNLLHIDGTSSPGLQISSGFSDGDDGLSISMEGSLAVYKVSYTGQHVFGIETRPGVWETGMAIKDTPVNGPVITTPQIVVGEPTGSDKGIGSLNAESIYINGEPVITGINPDYFVQGETIRRSYNYGASNPLNNNNRSAFYRLSVDDPSNPLPSTAYGIHINDTNTNKYGLDIVGRANRNEILWGGIDDGIRQPWREIHHSGVDYIKYDNNPAEVSHPTPSEDLGTSNRTLNPTKGIYYAQGRSDTQTITMGAPQFFGQVVEIVHNGLESLRVFCGPFNPPMIVNVPKYSILRLRAISTPQYIGWSPVT